MKSELQCPLCRRKLNEGDSYCTRCGKAGVPVVDTVRDEQADQTNTSFGSRKVPVGASIIIAAIAIAAISILVAMVVASNGNGDKRSSSSPQTSLASKANYASEFTGDWTLESQPYTEYGLRLASKGDLILRENGTGYSEWMREPENSTWQISWRAKSATEAEIAFGNDETYAFVLKDGKMVGTQNGVEVTYVRGATMNISSRSTSASQGTGSYNPTFEGTINAAIEDEK